jgi:peroxiredoxin
MTQFLRGRVLVLVAGAAVLGLVAVLAIASAQGVGSDEDGAGEASIDAAPQFALPTFDGGSFAITDHASGPIFVYFWASWCAPCERETPLIEQLWPEYEAAGYTFVAINMWDKEEDARAFVERHGLTFPVVRDEHGDAYLEFGVNQLPWAYFLAPGLAVDRQYVGELREDELREMLDAIGEPG